MLLRADSSSSAGQDVYHTGQIYSAAEHHKVGA